MNKWKNWVLGSGLVTVMLFLSGCVRLDSNGNPDTSGIVYRVLVHPMGQAITYLGELQLVLWLGCYFNDSHRSYHHFAIRY